jgi:hypothetical protein
VTVTPSDLVATLRRRYRAELAREADRWAEIRALLDRIVAELDHQHPLFASRGEKRFDQLFDLFIELIATGAESQVASE